MQDIDMMDISVLDEAEIDNTSAVDCGDDYSAENVLDTDNKVDTYEEMKEPPDQLMENEVSYWWQLLPQDCPTCPDLEPTFPNR